MNRELPQHPRRSTTANAFVRSAAVVALSVAMVFSSTLAGADELDDRKNKLDQQITQSKQDLHDYNREAAQAAANLQASQKALDDANAAVTRAEAAEATAKAKDQAAAAALRTAQQKLAAAKREAAKAKRDVDVWMRTVGRVVVQGQQQRTDLLGLAVLTTNTRMGSLNQRAQWGRTMQDSTQAKLDALRSLKLKKDGAQQAAAKIEQDVKAKRQAAADAYAAAQDATTASEQARSAQQQAVTQNQQAKAAADRQVAAEERRQADLKSESADVAKRILARIEAEKKAEAAREAAEAKARAQAEADRKAREAAEAEKRAAAKKPAQQEPAASTPTPYKPAVRTPARGPKIPHKVHRGLVYPSSGPITSPYGMRFHPVLRYWKLHDGTDFGASCGSPIRAAAPGRVTERYYNGGYGNRLIIDHGKYLDGNKYLTTTYNHATHYIVSPGEYVQQGQVVGYVGSTGYSTGCHLHFMTYVNGELVNPMSLY